MTEKNYHRKYNRHRYHRLRNQYIEILGGKCVICGSTDSLQFDHIDPTTKLIDISKLLNYSQSIVIAELTKCQLLCKTHHLEKSMNNKELGGGHNRIDIAEANHGTSIMYHKFKCKCDECRNWKRSSRKPL